MIVMQPHYQEFMNMIGVSLSEPHIVELLDTDKISFCLYTYGMSCHKSLAALIVHILESLTRSRR